MFKIGEFSKLVRVSARMLRYYEQCGLLKPTEIDKFTGYRLYSTEQIPMLFRITELRDMGFSVEEMLEILPRFGDAVFMREILERLTRINNDGSKHPVIFDNTTHTQELQHHKNKNQDGGIPTWTKQKRASREIANQVRQTFAVEGKETIGF